MAATVREAIRELMQQTMMTMETLLEASDRELTLASSHSCAQGKDLWTLLTNDIDHEKERARLIGSLIGLTDEQFNRETAPGQ